MGSAVNGLGGRRREDSLRLTVTRAPLTRNPDLRAVALQNMSRIAPSPLVTPLLALTLFAAAFSSQPADGARESQDTAPSAGPNATADDREAVVFVPGVTGSRLENPATGEVVWGDSSQVFSPKDRGYSTVLPLRNEAYDGLVATDVLSHLRLFGFSKEIYRPLERFLVRSGWRRGDLLRPTPAQNLYFFAYDWRYPNERATRELDQALRRLHRAGFAGIRLICQSNAGRICRYVAKYGAEPTGEGEPGAQTMPADRPYSIRQIVLVSNSNGGALRQLHELHNGRRYVPGIGRFMAPETLFALRTLFEDLPFYRTDLFLDENGVALDLDLYDASTWVEQGWSIFRPDLEDELDEPAARRLFGSRPDQIAYLEKRLAHARRVNELLMEPVPGYETRLCLLQNDSESTYERALVVENRGSFRLLFAGDRGVPRHLEPLLASPGDGHGTAESQDFLSAQESAAVQVRHEVFGGHFDTITRDDTLRRLVECLQMPVAAEATPADDPEPQPTGG